MGHVSNNSAGQTFTCNFLILLRGYIECSMHTTHAVPTRYNYLAAKVEEAPTVCVTCWAK